MTLKVTQVKGEALKIGKKCRKIALIQGEEITTFRGKRGLRGNPLSQFRSPRRDHEMGQTQMLSGIN